MKEFIDMEHVDIIFDLRTHNKGRQKSFEEFWSACEQVLNEEIGLAVTTEGTTWFALLHQRFLFTTYGRGQRLCPTEAAIPSKEWLCLVSLQYTGRLKVKYMVQQRQLRKDHCDSHYAAAVFKYMREYAVMVRDHCLCMQTHPKSGGARVPGCLSQTWKVNDGEERHCI